MPVETALGTVLAEKSSTRLQTEEHGSGAFSDHALSGGGGVEHVEHMVGFQCGYAVHHCPHLCGHGCGHRGVRELAVLDTALDSVGQYVEALSLHRSL